MPAFHYRVTGSSDAASSFQWRPAVCLTTRYFWVRAYRICPWRSGQHSCLRQRRYAVSAVDKIDEDIRLLSLIWPRSCGLSIAVKLFDRFNESVRHLWLNCQLRTQYSVREVSCQSSFRSIHEVFWFYDVAARIFQRLFPHVVVGNPSTDRCFLTGCIRFSGHAGISADGNVGQALRCFAEHDYLDVDVPLCSLSTVLIFTRLLVISIASWYRFKRCNAGTHGDLSLLIPSISTK